MATTNNVIGIIAKAIKKKHGDISNDIISLKDGYDLICDTFQINELEAERIFTGSYQNLDSANQLTETENFSSSLAVIQAIRDTIVNDDGDDTLVNTLAEMQEDISSSLAEYIEQDRVNELALQGFRNDIETRWGTISQYTAAFINNLDITTLTSNRYFFNFNGMSNSVSFTGTAQENQPYNLKDELTLSAWIKLDNDFFLTTSVENGGDGLNEFREFGIVDKFSTHPLVKGYHFGLKRMRGRNFNSIKLVLAIGRTNPVTGEPFDRNDDLDNPSLRRIEVRVNEKDANLILPNIPSHVAATYNRHENVAKLYIDGVKVAEGPIDGVGNIIRADEKFCVGNTTSDPGRQEFKGGIDELSVWDKALSPESIAQIYDWQSNGNLNVYAAGANISSNLLGWYRMGDPSDEYDRNVQHLDENGDPLTQSFDESGNPSTGILIPNGSWTLKSSTDLSDETKYLSTIGVGQKDRQSPGLIVATYVTVGLRSQTAGNAQKDLSRIVGNGIVQAHESCHVPETSQQMWIPSTTIPGQFNSVLNPNFDKGVAIMSQTIHQLDLNNPGQYIEVPNPNYDPNFVLPDNSQAMIFNAGPQMMMASFNTQTGQVVDLSARSFAESGFTTDAATLTKEVQIQAVTDGTQLNGIANDLTMALNSGEAAVPGGAFRVGDDMTLNTGVFISEDDSDFAAPLVPTDGVFIYSPDEDVPSNLVQFDVVEGIQRELDNDIFGIETLIFLSVCAQGGVGEDPFAMYQEGDFNELLQQAILENNMNAVEYIQGQMLLRNMEMTIDSLPNTDRRFRFTDDELGG